MLDLSGIRAREMMRLLSLSDSYIKHMTDDYIIYIIAEIGINEILDLLQMLKKYGKIDTIAIQLAVLERGTQFIKNIENPSEEALDFVLCKLGMKK